MNGNPGARWYEQIPRVSLTLMKFSRNARDAGRDDFAEIRDSSARMIHSARPRSGKHLFVWQSVNARSRVSRKFIFVGRRKLASTYNRVMYYATYYVPYNRINYVVCRRNLLSLCALSIWIVRSGWHGIGNHLTHTLSVQFKPKSCTGKLARVYFAKNVSSPIRHTCPRECNWIAIAKHNAYPVS